MIPTSPSNAVSWTAGAAPAAAPVPAVMGVAPAAPAGRDAQGGLEQRRGQPRAVAERASTAAANAEERREEALARAERGAQQAQQARERAQAQQEAMEQLRQTLRKVWDASGAVVEQALAREAEQAARAQGGGVARARPLDAYDAPPPAGKPGLSRRA